MLQWQINKKNFRHFFLSRFVSRFGAHIFLCLVPASRTNERWRTSVSRCGSLSAELLVLVVVEPVSSVVQGCEINDGSRFLLRFRFSRNAILRFHFRLRFPKTLETRNAISFFVSKPKKSPRI